MQDQVRLRASIRVRAAGDPETTAVLRRAPLPERVTRIEGLDLFAETDLLRRPERAKSFTGLTRLAAHLRERFVLFC